MNDKVKVTYSVRLTDGHVELIIKQLEHAAEVLRQRGMIYTAAECDEVIARCLAARKKAND